MLNEQVKPVVVGRDQTYPDRISGKQRIAIAALLAVIAVFQFSTLLPGHDWGDDFSMYIAHARNIVEGTPYSDTGYIYNRDEPIGPPRASPGLPLLLAPVYAVRGVDLMAMKGVMIVSFVAALALISALVTRWLGFVSALAVIAMLGFHPYFTGFKDNILTDLPFLFFFYLGIWLAQRRADGDNERDITFIHGVVPGILWWAAYCVRAVGALLPLAIVIHELVTSRRIRRSTVISIAVFGFLALLQGWLLQSPTDYLTNYSFRPGALRSQVAADVTFVSDLVTPALRGTAAFVVFCIASVLTLLGVIRSWKQGHHLPLIVAVIYLGSKLLWPFTEAGRYLIPVLPLYFFFLVSGLHWLAQIAGRWRPAVGLVAASVAAAMYVQEHRNYPAPDPAYRIETPEAQTLFQFFRRSTPPDAIAIFKKPRALALFTGRRAGVYTTTEKEDPWRFIDRIGATHFASVRASIMDSSYIAWLARTRPQSVSEIYRNPRFIVYDLAPRRAAAPDPAGP